MSEFATPTWTFIVAGVGGVAAILLVVREYYAIKKLRLEIDELKNTRAPNSTLTRLDRLARASRRNSLLIVALLAVLMSIYVVQGITVSTKVSELEARLARVVEVQLPRRPADASISAVHPEIQNALQASGLSPDDIPTRDEVRALANYFGLLDVPPFNRHLRFLSGDIAFWHEQRLPALDLAVQFVARKIVLETAARTEQKIPNQGDLSALAQKIMSRLYQELDSE